MKWFKTRYSKTSQLRLSKIEKIIPIFLLVKAALFVLYYTWPLYVWIGTILSSVATRKQVKKVLII
jgi:hypothetical protein